MRRRTPRSIRAMSLIEVLIVIVIIAVAAGGATWGFGALTRSKLRSASVKLASASRFAYNHAVAHGSTVRIVLDLSGNQIGFEEAHGSIVLDRSEDRELDESEDNAATDPWAAARATLEETLAVNTGRSAFGPIVDGEGEARSRYQTQELEDGIRILKLITPHEPEPREEGKGYVYYWPAGQSERAVIQLVDGSDHVYSVAIHPLTGRARVYPYAYEPDEVEEPEVRDPG